MNKVLFVLPFLMFGLISPVFAEKNNGTGTQTGVQIQQQMQQQAQTTIVPTGVQTKNQNQVKTQSKNEDSQLQVETQEQEGLKESTSGGSQNRNVNAVLNMSEVAKYVQLLLQVRTAGGIGDQVREIAREQNQAQDQIQEQLNKLESRSKLARLLTGTDYNAIRNLKTQLVQNQLRIEQLEQLQNQLSNQGEVTMVQETIRILTEQNVILQDKINLEEKYGSLFGWFFRLFAKQ